MSANHNSASSSTSQQWPPMTLPPSSFSSPPPNNNESTILANMNYCAPSVSLIRARRDLGGDTSPIEGASWDTKTISLSNGRHRTPPTLDKSGFTLLPHAPVAPDVDYFDRHSVVASYYPQCENLVKTYTGATIVKAFDHNVRSTLRNGQRMSSDDSSKIQDPVGVVHNDYTRQSAPRRLKQLSDVPTSNDVLEKSVLDEEVVDAVSRGERRFAFVNVWRNVREEPVRRNPLACVDGRSNNEGDLVTFEIVYKDRIGENYFVKYSEKQEWVYFKEMTKDEALLIKQWDSEGGIAKGHDRDIISSDDDDDDVCTFSIHSSFLDSSTTDDDPPRESIEVRCVCVW